MGVLEIFDRCRGVICKVSWRYLMGVLEIFDRCPRDILSVSCRYFLLSWRYLIGVQRHFLGDMDIFYP